MTSVAERVLAALAEVAEFDEVRTNPDLELYKDHILDSLKTVELILLLSERLGLDISPAELDQTEWGTPARIVHYFEARMKA